MNESQKNKKLEYQAPDPSTVEGMCEITAEKANSYWEARYKSKCPYLEIQPIMNFHSIKEREQKKTEMQYRVPAYNNNNNNNNNNSNQNTFKSNHASSSVATSSKYFNKHNSNVINNLGPDRKPRKKKINYVLANKNVQSSVDWMPSKRYIHNTRDYNPKLNKNYPQRDEKRKIKIRGVHHGHNVGEKIKVDPAESYELEKSHLVLKRINEAIVYGNVYLPLMKGDKAPSISDLNNNEISNTKRKGTFDNNKTKTRGLKHQDSNARQRLSHPYQ